MPRWQQLRPSVAVQLVVLLLIFAAVPAIIYAELRASDDEKKELLLNSVKEQGRMVKLAMTPLLSQSPPAPLPVIGRELARFGSEETRIRLLLRPAQISDGDGFFYVAATPARPNEYLEAEREQLQREGILERLATTCEAELPLALRYHTPEGRLDVVSSVMPIRSAAGCWAIVISHGGTGTGAILGRPYWQSPEVRIAAAIYVSMALLVLTMFVVLWRGLRRFGRLASDIRRHGPHGSSFADQNLVSELAPVAREFDRMVETLNNSAAAIRRAAEENLHDFKTPIAVIRQSVEPLRRLTPADSERGMRALNLIEKSLDRLDALTNQARRLDEANADIIDSPMTDIEISPLLDQLLTNYADLFRSQGRTLDFRLEDGVRIRGNADLLETVMENIVDNALDFSPPGSTVRVTLERQKSEAEIVIADQGPGVETGDLEDIFNRHYSRPRPQTAPDSTSSHFGLGLWIVRRNVAAMGGSVTAERAVPRGLRIRIRLPLANAPAGWRGERAGHAG